MRPTGAAHGDQAVVREEAGGSARRGRRDGDEGEEEGEEGEGHDSGHRVPPRRRKARQD